MSPGVGRLIPRRNRNSDNIIIAAKIQLIGAIIAAIIIAAVSLFGIFSQKALALKNIDTSENSSNKKNQKKDRYEAPSIPILYTSSTTKDPSEWPVRPLAIQRIEEKYVIKTYEHESIISKTKGRVIFCGTHPEESGKTVIIKTDDDYHYRYAGFETIYVKVGQNISPEDVLGVVEKNDQSDSSLNIMITKDAKSIEIKNPESVVSGQYQTISDYNQINNPDDVIFPILNKYSLSSGYGWRKDPLTGNPIFHSGIDIMAVSGTLVRSAIDGKVLAIGYNIATGNYIIISHKKNYATLYSHLNKIYVYENNNVKIGEIIGTVGNSGYSTGPHLHFAVYKDGKTINPLNIFSVDFTETNEIPSALELDVENYKTKKEQRFISKIIIDPGHGGNDYGGNATYIKNGAAINIFEKTINLDISKKLYGYLSKLYPTREIILIRTDDISLSLEERVNLSSHAIENNEDAIFISIHANSSFSNKQMSGFEIWYYQNNILEYSDYENYSSELLANTVLNGIESSVGSMSPSQGIKTEDWFLLRRNIMPSILIETGFISNQQDAELLVDSDYQDLLIQGIADGINRFVILYEGTDMIR